MLPLLKSAPNDILGVVNSNAGNYAIPRTLNFRIANLEEEIASFQPQLVLNVAAKWGRGTDPDAINEASYLMPMRVATALEDRKVTWLQVDSYFNLFYLLSRTDKDTYSAVKRHFFDAIREGHPNIAISQVFAPHFVGNEEPSGRLFHELAKGHVLKRAISLGSGGQYVRFSSLNDVAAQIAWLIDFSEKSEAALPQRIELKFAGCMTVKSLNQSFAKYLNSDPNLARYGVLPDAEAEFYERVPIYFPFEELPECRDNLQAIVLGLAERFIT